ncbi:hypothetical protein Tco_1282793 [Tanacetum coccineum]
MDDPNLTMEEYIRLEEEKAHKREKVFNWQTATYGKIRVDDDLHNFSSVEAEFPAIVINDAVAPQDEIQCKSQVSTPVNDEIDFRISFDESDDEDYTIFFDKNSFSYKVISVNDLKMDLENDYEKNEFPAIVYNDDQTSKSDLLTEPNLNPQHIDEFDLNDKTSLFEYNKEEQNFLYFNDLPPFNIIRPDNLKSEKDNDDNMALPLREQRYKFLRYEGLEYPDTNIFDFEGRFARIHRREVHMVILDLDTPGTLQFQLGEARRHMSWRQFILALGLHTRRRRCGRLGMDVGSVNVPYLLARYLRLFAARRKSGAHISSGQFVARLPKQFGLFTVEETGGYRYQDRNAPVFPIFYAGPREGNIDEYWWRIYESGNLEVLES